jgi:uncharacterized protein YjaZ
MSHQIKPSAEELEEAEEIVDTALLEAEEKMPMEQEVIVELGWTESDFTINEMDGASGYAKYPNIIDLDFNTSADKWQESLRASAFHEYAHTWDYEKRGQQWDTRWEYILGEALTQHFAEQNAEYQSPWRTRHSREDIAEHWNKIRDEELDHEYQNDGGNDPLFINKGDGEYPNWLGYSLAWQIGEQLLQEYSLEDLPELNKEDVVEAGNEIYTET